MIMTHQGEARRLKKENESLKATLALKAESFMMPAEKRRISCGCWGEIEYLEWQKGLIAWRFVPSAGQAMSRIQTAQTVSELETFARRWAGEAGRQSGKQQTANSKQANERE